MANKTERSFTFDVDGVPRCLFRSYENTTGTVILNLIPWGHPNYKPYISTDASEPFTPNIDSPLKQSRYSIHTSDDNPRNETFIKLTDDYANGRKVTSVICTTALKQFNDYTPIFCRRFDDIRGAHYDIAPSRVRRVHLAQSKPQFIPVVGVFVGPKGRPFDCNAFQFLQLKFDFKEEKFARFTLVFVWSFILSIGPCDVIADSHLSTTRETGPLPFRSAIECTAWYTFQRQNLKEDLLQRLNYSPNAPHVRELISSTAYFREARTDTPQYEEFQRKSQPLATFR